MSSTHATLLISADTPAHRLAPQCKVAATTRAASGIAWAAALTIPPLTKIGTVLA